VVVGDATNSTQLNFELNSTLYYRVSAILRTAQAPASSYVLGTMQTSAESTLARPSLQCDLSERGDSNGSMSLILVVSLTPFPSF